MEGLQNLKDLGVFQFKTLSTLVSHYNKGYLSTILNMVAIFSLIIVFVQHASIMEYLFFTGVLLLYVFGFIMYVRKIMRVFENQNEGSLAWAFS
jgi:hypothetical protein